MVLKGIRRCRRALVKAANMSMAFCSKSTYSQKISAMLPALARDKRLIAYIIDSVIERANARAILCDMQYSKPAAQPEMNRRRATSNDN